MAGKPAAHFKQRLEPPRFAYDHHDEMARANEQLSTAAAAPPAAAAAGGGDSSWLNPRSWVTPSADRRDRRRRRSGSDVDDE